MKYIRYPIYIIFSGMEQSKKDLRQEFLSIMDMQWQSYWFMISQIEFNNIFSILQYI